MNRQGRAGHVRLPAITMLVALVAACSSSTATTPPTVAPATLAPAASVITPSATPPPTARPTQTPTATQASSAAVRTLPGFTTPAALASDAAWTSLDVAPLAANDPLATVISMARWNGGFVALGEPITNTNHDGTARTPVWTSSDGATWNPLDPAVLGPSTAVLAVGRLGDGVVAITATADMTECGADVEDCYNAAPPLQAWTSTDGMTWTAHPVPSLLAKVGAVDPAIAIGDGGVVVVTYDDASGLPAATWSDDGAAWSALVPSAFGPKDQVTRVSALGSGFVAVGDTGGEQPAARAWSSPDGTTWQGHPLPYPGAPKSIGTSAGAIDVGPAGVLAEGEVQATPGSGVWWTSPDGMAWTTVKDYAPLGTWNGPGEGTGVIEDGAIDSDGERVLAARTEGGTAAWQSTDGAHWTSLPVQGLKASPKDSYPVLGMRVLPVGVLFDDGDGHLSFGVPKG